MNNINIENEIGTDSSNNIITKDNLLTEEENEKVAELYSKKKNYNVLTDEKENYLSTNDNNQSISIIEKSLDKRSIFKKLFSKIEEGSLRGCIFNLCILSLGTGCLALPQKIQYITIIFSPIIIILAGIANIWSLLLLSEMSSKYHITKYDELVKKLLGKTLSLLLDITMILNQSGMIILYQVILYKLTGGIVKEIGGYDSYENIEEFSKKSFWKKYSYKFSVCYGISFVILLPLCLQKDINKMRYSSTFGIYSLFLLVLIIIIECPFFIAEYEDSVKLNFYNILKGFDSEMNFLKSISTLFYAFSCHVGAFPVIESLKNPTKKRINKVFKSAICLDIICYLLIGLTGYLSQPIDTPDLIIERTNLKKFKHDYIMLFGQICFILTLFAKICANWNALRVSLLSILGKDSKKYTNFLNAILTISFLIISTLIAVLFQSVSDYISLIGSFCSVIICFIIPGLIYIKGNQYRLSNYKNILTIILIVFMACFGAVSGIFTIIKIVK